MDFKTFGEWLRHRRLQLDISPFRMSEELGYKRVSAIYNFEYGVAPLPMAKWPAMARVLELTLEEFLAIMEHYAPQKVGEFRTIREAESAKVPSEERSAHNERIAPSPMPEKETQGQGLKTYNLMDGERRLMEQPYRVLPGPEAFFTPAAARMGIVLPEPGEAHIEGRIVPEEEAMEVAARKLIEAKNPTLHPGPLVLWNWNEKAAKKAKAIKVLADVIPARIIPMADYRPKYPKINPEVEINPNHPNLTIWHNKEDVCLFVGVHCHQANLALKIIRGGTSCYTIAMCAMAGHEDAMLSFRDATAEKILRLAEWVSKLKDRDMMLDTG